MDPSIRARVDMSSLHLRDDYPTEENAFPTELLEEGSGGERKKVEEKPFASSLTLEYFFIVNLKSQNFFRY
jgi:hypothetical protein